MAKFIVERYEIHTQKVEVEANSRAEALHEVIRNGGGKAVGAAEYLCTDEERGMDCSTPLYQELITYEKAKGIGSGHVYFDGMIPTVRSIVQQLKY